MASTNPAANSPVPDHGSMDGDPHSAGAQDSDDDAEEPMDPWEGAAREIRSSRIPDPEEFQRFRDFMQQRAPSRSWRPRRASEDYDDRDDDSKGASSGPPPTWDGQSSFRDYHIRAKLWLATTKVRPKARGPMLLKSLTGTPFDDLKHLAKDAAWMQDDKNGELLLAQMDTKELYGEDAREDMLNTLVKITYTLRRAKGEGHKLFFSRWDNQVRRLGEHSVTLPPEYLGFLLVMSLQLSGDEVKLLLNYTQGKLTAKAVKEWVRVHEADLDWKAQGKPAAKPHATMLMEGVRDDDDDDGGPGDEPSSGELEVLLGALGELEDGDATATEDGIPQEVFDEEEAKEILAAMVKDQVRPPGKRTFAAVNQAKKHRHLARGFGTRRDAGGERFPTPRGSGPQTYRVSIEALKKRTRCGICKEIGHWHKECPRKGAAGPKESHLLEPAANDEAYFVEYLEYLNFVEETNGRATSSSAGRFGSDSRSQQRAGYMDRVHEVWYSTCSASVPEEHCATVDTGCQRTAVGKLTLDKYLRGQPDGIKIAYKNEQHCFKSVNGITQTRQVACVPTSLGPKGCVLRPAVFEDGLSQSAPFLLSLPFLLFCRATLHLDPTKGLRMYLGRFRHTVSLHIGPTGALRVPLSEFTSRMVADLQGFMSRLPVQHPSEDEINHVREELGPSDQSFRSSREPCPSGSSSSCNAGAGIQEDTSGRARRENSRGTVAEDDLAVFHGHEPVAGANAHVQGRHPEPPRPCDDPGVQHDAVPGQRSSTSSTGSHRPSPEGTRPGEGDRRRPGLHEVDAEHGKHHDQFLRGGQRHGCLWKRQRQPALRVRFDDGGAPDAQAGAQLPAAILPVPEVEEPGPAMQLLPVAGQAATVARQLVATNSGADAGEGGPIPTAGERGHPAKEHLLCQPGPLRASDHHRCRDECLPDPAQVLHVHEAPLPEGQEDWEHPVPRPGLRGSKVPAEGAAGNRSLGLGRVFRVHHPGERLLERAEEHQLGAVVASKAQAHQGQEPREACEGDVGDGGGGDGLPRVSPVEALPGVQEDGEGRHHIVRAARVSQSAGKTQRLVPRRLFTSVLRRWEAVWSELIRCLGPEAQSSLEVLKKRALDELSRPNKKHLAYYSELFSLSPKSLQTVAEVYRPERASHDDRRTQIRTVLEVEVGSACLSPVARESIRRCLRHDRPGLVIIACSGSFPPQRSRLAKGFREVDIAAWKRHVQATKDAKILQQFALELCYMCNCQGSRFVFHVPRLVNGGCERQLRDLNQESGVYKLRDPVANDTEAYIVTNGPAIVERARTRTGKMDVKTSQGEPHHRIREAYCSLTSRREKGLSVICAADIIEEDRRHDEAYFDPAELAEIHLLTEKGGCVHEVHAGEDGELPELPCRGDHPANHGVEDDHLREGGWKQIDEDTWAHVDLDGGHLVTPTGTEFQPEDFPWRSSWTKDGERWSQVEDEIRWRDLRDQARAVPGAPLIVTIFRRKADTKNGRSMRHFPGMQKITLERMVRRAHEGLGHPERERFLRILRHSKAPEEVIEIAKGLRCSTCEAYKLPDPARRGAPPREQVYVNDLVGIDTIHIRDHRNQAVPAVNIVDWHSHFQLVVPMKGETAEHVRAAYRQWTRFFGPPRRLMIDLGPEYKAQFRKQAEQDGSEVIPSSVEAPYQRGLTERAGGIYKNILYKAMQDYQCQNEMEWRELVDTACMTRNRLLLRAGYSPIQRVLGYSPRLPGGLYTNWRRTGPHGGGPRTHR